MKTQASTSRKSRRKQNSAAPETRPAAPPAPARRPLLALLPWAALPLLALLVYLPALRAGYVWDDDALTDNPVVRSLGGIWAIWFKPWLTHKESHYWPLVYSSFWLEHRLVGIHPFLYHLDNILLHGAACVLLWRVLKKLAVPGAWLAAALFAVHPVHVESVAWVIERKDVLSGVFYFGAALAFLHFHELPASEPPHRRWTLYALSFALFAAALLSKSIVVTLPLALALILWLRHGRLTRRDLALLLPLLALAAVVTFFDLKLVAMRTKAAEFSGLSLPGRIQLAAGSFWFYLGKLAWPYPLMTIYPKWAVNPHALSGWAPLLGAGALFAGLWMARGRIGRGPLAAAAFFGLTLGPALGLMDFGFLHLAWVADRFQYLASAGPLALAAAALTALARRLSWPQAARRCAAAALLAALGLLCLRQAAFYNDWLTLSRATLAVHPASWVAQLQCGCALLEGGRSEEAAAHFREALRLAPAPDAAGPAHYLAQALTRLGRYAEADPYYREALERDPSDATAHLNYGVCLLSLGRLPEAGRQFSEAARLKPQDAELLFRLGEAQLAVKNPAEALGCYQEALRLNPAHPRALQRLRELGAR